jgi:hypothetical protein
MKKHHMGHSKHHSKHHSEHEMHHSKHHSKHHSMHHSEHSEHHSRHDHAESQPKGYGFGENAKEPKGVKASDAGGERHGKIVNGIAMGKADAVSEHAFDGGRHHGVCYEHVRGGK